jgi:hypothetical protein
LGQYTHRIEISNHRAVKVEDGCVYFKVRDRESEDKKKIMSLPVLEFMHRFLLHALPKAFVRIRHFGLLGSRLKQAKVALVRKLQGFKEQAQVILQETWKDLLKKVCAVDADKCPSCGAGVLVKTKIFLPTISTA